MHLFRPLTIGPVQMPNRIVFSAAASGCAHSDGYANAQLAAYYCTRAQGGAGLIVLEAACPLAPTGASTPHLGLYDDRFVPDLRTAIEQIRQQKTCVVVMLDQPLDIETCSSADLRDVTRLWMMAAQRASVAGADGIMLSCADGGPFHQLVSPLRNHRLDEYGGTLGGRTRLLLETLERLHARFGNRMLIGLRMLVEEFTPGGITLQDARVIARRLTVAGARLVEAHASTAGTAQVALFPGWSAPLAAAIRAVVDVPVMVGDLNADADLADSLIGDRCADLIALTDVLHDDPTWPRKARIALGIG